MTGKIKISLDKGKNIGNKWENEKELCFAINESLEFEKDNSYINKIFETINKYNESLSHIFLGVKKMKLINSLIL